MKEKLGSVCSSSVSIAAPSLTGTYTPFRIYTVINYEQMALVKVLRYSMHTKHAHKGQKHTDNMDTPPRRHTDEWNGPELGRLTFASSHLGRGELSQLLLYVVQDFHWVLVCAGFQPIPTAHCGCGHTQLHRAHTQQKHATHTHTHINMSARPQI